MYSMIGGGRKSYNLFSLGPPTSQVNELTSQINELTSQINELMSQINELTSQITGSGRQHLQVSVSCGEANFKKGGHSKELY